MPGQMGEIGVQLWRGPRLPVHRGQQELEEARVGVGAHRNVVGAKLPLHLRNPGSGILAHLGLTRLSSSALLKATRVPFSRHPARIALTVLLSCALVEGCDRSTQALPRRWVSPRRDIGKGEFCQKVGRNCPSFPLPRACG